jgi:hypothetical protein
VRILACEGIIDISSIGKSIHEALAAVFDCASLDRFQIITRQKDAFLIDDTLILEVTLYEGRPWPIKKELYEKIRLLLWQRFGIEKICIILVETSPANWSVDHRGHYAEKEEDV